MTSSEKDAKQTRRRRRTSEEVRTLILRAAVELFAEKGFAGTTTREVAQRAGVGEPTMFRIYETKERLYQEAVLGPFEEFLEDFALRWMAAETPGGEPREVLGQFVRELHALVAQNRELFSAIPWHQPLPPRAQASLIHLERVGAAIADRHGLEFDIEVAVRVATTTVVATTLFEETVFPPDLRGERLLRELTRMLVGATLHRDEARPEPF